MFGKDFGTDLHICRANVYEQNGSRRFVTSGRQIDIQLKSVMEHNVTLGEQNVHYYLESKNYNDLIYRRNEGDALIPLLLVVFIFPTDEGEWVLVSEEDLKIKRHAYWYYPDEKADFTSNTTSQVVKIPRSNRIDLDFFPMIFNYFR